MHQVALVDDDRSICQLVADILSNFEVHCAVNASEALRSSDPAPSTSR
jgi:DNA-binding response OmpR family regulator